VLQYAPVFVFPKNGCFGILDLVSSQETGSEEHLPKIIYFVLSRLQWDVKP